VPILSRTTSSEIAPADLGADYTRVDIEFEGVEHGGSSYEGRVYINNPEADADTERSPESGYAGSYYVFGHGGCYGDQGHCDVVARAPYDPRPPHGLLPTRKVVVATEAVKRAAAAGASLTVSVVPVLLSTTDNVPDDEPLPNFGAMSVISYQ
jgi:hypothetical protein